MVLHVIKRQETLTFSDLAIATDFGVDPNLYHLRALVNDLEKKKLIETLNGVSPQMYTITDKGMIEGRRCDAEESMR